MMTALSLLFFILLQVSLSASSSAHPAASSSPRRPYVIAHRGASGELPEHTAAAYYKAIEQGADFIECDVVVTKDLKLICRHEPNLIATTDAAQRFPARWRKDVIDGEEVEGVFACDLTLEEVRTLRARQRWPFRDLSRDGQYPVMTLDEHLDIAQAAARVVGVYPETKHPTWHNALPALTAANTTIEELVLAVLHRRGYRGPFHSAHWLRQPVFIQSFEPTSLQRMARRSSIPLVLLMGGWEGYRTPDTGLTHEQVVSEEGLAALAKYATGVGPWKDSLLDVEASQEGVPTSSGLAERLMAAGLQVHPYTFRDESRFVLKPFIGNPQAELRFMFEELGIGGAFSDFPSSLHAVVCGEGSTACVGSVFAARQRQARGPFATI